ncbi:MAG TPA: DUF4079 domain-containing protein [Stenomitos sp.]
MALKDTFLLLHPIAAVVIVFPLLGITLHRALQVRQRRLSDHKSRIPATVGQEHVGIGRWLAGSVIGLVLLALGNDVLGNIIENRIWQQDPFKVGLIGILFGVAIAAPFLLYQAKTRLWRGTFAILSAISLLILGAQDGVYRKSDQWYVSHYYYGITAAILMLLSVAILREIYQDKTHRWRIAHIVLNSLALLLFMGQGITGTQALLEVPLSWQEPYIQQLYEQHCEQAACKIESATSLPKTQ